MKQLAAVSLLGAVLLVTPVWAESTRLIPVNYTDASVLASYLGGLSPGGGYSPAVAEAFARETIAMGVRRLPGGEGEWAYNAGGHSYPGGGMALVRPPAGLTQPPVALPAQNALLVRGSADAIDQLQELVRMLDKPVPMVNVDLKLEDQPEEDVREWGVDLQTFGGGVAAGTTGNAPAAGAQVRYGVAEVAAAAGLDLRRSRGRNTLGASVTTFNGAPATVSFGQVLPFFVSRTSYDAFGNRHVDTEPYAVFTGIELYVLPRITGSDTVTMRLVPTITEAAGAVTAPDGSSIPITRSVLTDTQVRVRDGESLVIAGLDRLSDTQVDRFRTALGERTVKRTSHPVLIVTPHIVREQ